MKGVGNQPDAQPDAAGDSVTAQGAVVAGMTFLSRITGFLRDMAFSHYLGAGVSADAFLVAFRIPNFFRRLFAEGAFSQAFVPVLARYRQLGQVELRQLVAVVGGNLTLLLILVVLLGILLANPLTLIFAPGFAGDGERLQMTASLLRVTFPYLGFISLTAFAGALLNVHGRYALPAVTPVLLNACLIAAMLFAAWAGAEMAPALAWGVLAAGVVQLCAQAPGVARLGLLTLPKASLRDPGAAEVGRLLTPALIASSAGQLNALIGTVLASMLMTGSIAWLYYADRLMELPIGLVAAALGTVLLPNLSRLAGANARSEFAATLDWGLRVGILLGLPASVALVLLAEPLVATIFHHGRMTDVDVLRSAEALVAFACGVLPLVLVKVLAPAFFAHKDTRTPLNYALISVAVNLLAGLATFQWLHHVGLALATSIAAWVQAGLLWRGVLRSGYYQRTPDLARTLGRALLATACMAVCLLLLTPADTFWLERSPLGRAPWLAGLVTLGALVYGGVAWLAGLRPSELIHRA